MKLSIKTIAILFATATIYSCNNGETKTTTGNSDSSAKDATTVATDTLKTAPTTASTSSSSAEQDFINYVVPANTKELIWLNAGLKNGANDIKEHSKMMIKDHTKMGAEVKAWLSKNSTVTAPVVDTAGVVDINDKKGEDWNKAWADKMVSDHKDLLDKLDKAKKDVKDSALAKIITGAIPVVTGHLAMANMVKEKHK